MIEQIRWLGHGSFVIQGPPLICINPWRVPGSDFHADAILVGHEHYDHCSPADIEKLSAPSTTIIGSQRAAAELDRCVALRPWQSYQVDRALIKAVPAYSPDHARHPASAGGLGFVISLNYYDIYYAGDTGLIPEMARIHPDIAILPISGDGTMTVDEAVEAVKLLRPRWTFPANWGRVAEGATYLDARQFQEKARGLTKVIIAGHAREIQRIS